MTCYFNPSQGTFDAYDHEGTKVASDREIKDSYDIDGDGRVVDPPQDFLDALYEAREGNQPSAYNQELLFCISAHQFQEGTPP